MELLPEDYLRNRRRRRANMRYLVLSAVVITAVVCAEVVSEQKLKKALAHQDQVNAAHAEAGNLLAQMHELEARKAEMLRKADLTASLIDRVPCSTLLGAITNALTPEVVVKSLDLQTHTVVARPEKSSPKKQTQTKFTASSREKAPARSSTLLSIQVTGLAADDAQVAKFIANLSGNALIDKVDMAYSLERKTKDLTVREFRIRVSVRPGIDAIDVLRKSGTPHARRRPVKAGQRGES